MMQGGIGAVQEVEHAQENPAVAGLRAPGGSRRCQIVAVDTNAGRSRKIAANRLGNYGKGRNGTEARPRGRNGQTDPDAIHPVSWNGAGKVPGSGGTVRNTTHTPGVDFAAGQDERKNLAAVKPKRHRKADPGSIQPVARNGDSCVLGEACCIDIGPGYDEGSHRPFSLTDWQGETDPTPVEPVTGVSCVSGGLRGSESRRIDIASGHDDRFDNTAN